MELELEYVLFASLVLLLAFGPFIYNKIKKRFKK